MGLAWYDDLDATISTPPVFSGVEGGTPSTAQEFHIWNDLGGGASPTATNLSVSVLAKDAGDPDFLACGHEFVDRQYFEARILNGLGGLSASTGPWVDLGCPGAKLELPEIPSGEGVAIEVRVSAPSDAPTAQYSPLLRLNNTTAQSLGSAGEAVGDGILVGAGGRAELMAISGDVVENPGGADDEIQTPHFIWRAGGNTWAQQEQLVELDQDDGDSATLAAGEAYYAILYGASDGTLAIAKGSKATAPLSVSDEPAIPNDGVPLCRALVDDSGVISDSEIDQRHELGAFGFTGTTLTVTIGPGVGIVRSKLAEIQSETQVSLTASSTNYVWLTSNGVLSVTTTSAEPSEGGKLLWVATTDSSNVTALEDRRAIGGSRKRHNIRFEFASGFATNDTAHAFYPEAAPGNLSLAGIVAALYEAWSGGSSGSVDFDLEYLEPGGSWTSIFPAGNGAPSIAHDASDPFTKSAFPDAGQIPGCSRLRATVTATPTGGSTAEGAELIVGLEV